ncbi:MAG: YfgM family protein [Candidatus Rariloculaceae bacterium]
MDDYLSEKEQLEAIREWWHEYGWYLVGGVVLGVATLFGMRQLDSYQQEQAETAALLFREYQVAVSDDADAEATGLLEQLREEYPDSAYTDQAGMLSVLMHLQNQSTRQAVDALRYTLENTSDENLAMIARLRLARLLVSDNRMDEAVTLIDSADPGAFEAKYSELRGDIRFAQGDMEGARSAYLQALNGEESELIDRNLIQMKLDDLASPTASASDEEVLSEDAGG